MSDLTAPDFLPVLSDGSHKSPAEGACYMEYVSLLAGEKFSDYPRCVDRALARTMQDINDDAGDEKERAELLPLLPRTIGLGAPPRLQRPASVDRLSPLWSEWVRTIEQDRRRYSRDTQKLRELAWRAFGKRVSIDVEDMADLESALSKDDPDSLALWFSTKLCRAGIAEPELTSDMEISIRWATWLHEAYESAMRTLGWPVVREPVCTLPEAAALVGAGVSDG